MNYFVDNTEQSVLSFCSGYSGIELGLGLAGLKHRVVAYVEIEAFAVANLVEKMETGRLVPAPVWTNLKTFPMEKFRGRVHGLTAGYPCQPFSHAGQRKGEEDPRHLWPTIRGAVDVIRPDWCFFENVEGHISLGLSTVVSDLEEMGYEVSWGIFSASEVGAPHQRKRVFILANPRLRYGRTKQRKQQEECPKEFYGSNKLANPPQHDRRWRTIWREALRSGSYSTLWPARPGEEQYEWEEPRTVESRMGRTTHGTSSRVDRLRLLGNGVVPQQAAKAWITLTKVDGLFRDNK